MLDNIVNIIFVGFFDWNIGIWKIFGDRLKII